MSPPRTAGARRICINTARMIHKSEHDAWIVTVKSQCFHPRPSIFLYSQRLVEVQHNSEVKQPFYDTPCRIVVLWMLWVWDGGNDIYSSYFNLVPFIT